MFVKLPSANTALLTHTSPAALYAIAKFVNTPLPAGITLPVNEKPSAVLPPLDTSKPAAAASPPDPPAKETPLISNWNPLIAW